MRALLLAVVMLSAPAAIVAEQAAPWTVSNEQLAITLGQETHGAIVSLVDRRSGRELAAAGAKDRLFELEFSTTEDGTSKRLVLSSQDAKQVTCSAMPAPGKGLELRFSQLADRPIEVVCRVQPIDGLPFLGWRLEADFPAPLILEAVRFPIVNLALAGGKSGDDALVLGTTKGGLYPRINGWKLGQSTNATQPGSLAAQMACYYGPELGLLSAALDNRGYRKTVLATRTDQGVALTWQQACYATSHHAQDYDFALSTFQSGEADRPTDWRDGADLYKQWAVQQPWCRRTFDQREDLPAWLRSGPALVRFGRQWLSEPVRIETWLRDYWKRSFPADTPLIVAYWGWEKINTWITPDYFPVFPSDEQFRQMTDLGRQLGAHSFVWPSGYHYTLTYKKLPSGEFQWDDRSRFDATARPHAIVDRDGQTHIGPRGWLEGGQTATMCPGDPWTIDWFNQIAIGLAQRGAELIQVDQVVGGNSPPCYSTAHGHPAGPGLWATEAFRRQLETTLQVCRAVQSEAVVCFEEPNEQFIQEVGLQDYRDWEVLQRSGMQLASVFNYLYHEYLPTFQSNPQPGNRLQAAYCLVNGQMPHLSPSPNVGPGPLLMTGDFERCQGTLPANWNRVSGYQGRDFTGEAAADEAEKHGGRFSLRLRNQEAGQMVQVAQNVPVGGAFAVGHTYRLRAWVKSAGLQERNALGLAALTDGIKSLGGWWIPVPSSSSDWVSGEVQFTLPEGTKELRIMLQIHGPGTAWVDDLVLEEVQQDGTGTVVPRPETPADHAFMRQWVELYHGSGRPYLFLGKMLHPPRLDVETFQAHGRTFPAILHNAFAAADGSRAVVLVNVTDSPKTGTLAWNGQQQAISLQPWEIRLISDRP